MSSTYFKYPQNNNASKSVFIVPILNDNYVFVLVNNKNQGLIIDPGVGDPIIDFLESRKIHPVAVLVTHGHHDHVGGLSQIRSRYTDIQMIDYSYIKSYTEIEICGFQFEIVNSPGHVKHHLMFYEKNEKWLFCGDILFRYGCGRIFEGSFEELFSSLQKIKNLPKESYIFCTHEYTKRNLEFCLAHQLIEESKSSVLMLEAQMIPTIPFSLEKELSLNPFLKASTVEQFKEWRLLRNKF